jgi:hypothetical protein
MKRIFAGLMLSALAACAAPQRPAVAPTQASVEPTVPLPPPPPKGEPQGFAGIDAARLTALAGTPAFTRKDGATEMWRYDAGSCRVFFFFTGAPARVQHIETMPRGQNAAADPQCLTALQASKRS